MTIGESKAILYCPFCELVRLLMQSSSDLDRLDYETIKIHLVVSHHIKTDWITP